MALRRLLACCAVVLASCKGGDTTKGADPSARCDQLAKACSDDKHLGKLVEACTQATTKSCADKSSALYDCYEKELCGKDNKIWALDDFRVLAARSGKCATEQKAVAECAGK